MKRLQQLLILLFNVIAMSPSLSVSAFNPSCRIVEPITSEKLPEVYTDVIQIKEDFASTQMVALHESLDDIIQYDQPHHLHPFCAAPLAKHKVFHIHASRLFSNSTNQVNLRLAGLEFYRVETIDSAAFKINF